MWNQSFFLLMKLTTFLTFVNFNTVKIQNLHTQFILLL
jgi:hypothetical protein